MKFIWEIWVNIFKRGVSSEEFGHGMWLACCDSAEKFCEEYRPQLESAGYLKNSTADSIFVDETLRLHLWLVSRSLGVSDSKILDAMHNYAHHLSHVNSLSISELYAIYDKAASEEMELIDAGRSYPVLAITVLQYIVNDKNYSNIVIAMGIHCDIDTRIKTFREIRAKTAIRN